MYFYSRKLIFVILAFLLNSCSWFDGLFEEEEVKLPGLREKVFLIEEKQVLKSNLIVNLPEPKEIENWSQTNQNPLNHLFHFSSNKNLKKKWEVNIGEGEKKGKPYLATPIVYKKIIFTVSNDSKLQARDSNNGKLIWSRVFKDEKEEDINFSGGLSASKDILIISTGLGNVYALDYKKGTQIWKKNLLSQISAPPATHNQKIFLTTDDNQLLVLDLFTGNTLWSHSGNIETVSIFGGVSPAISNSNVFVTYTSGEIFALNEKNGNLLWDVNLNSEAQFNEILISDIQSPATIFENNLFVSNSSGKIASIDVIDGEKNWELDLFTINPIVISGNFIFLLTSDNKIYCLSKKDGKVVWASQLKKKQKDQIFWVGPLLSSFKLILASSDGTLLSLSPLNGQVLSSKKIKDGINIQPIQAGKSIYFVTRKGNLLAFE